MSGAGRDGVDRGPARPRPGPSSLAIASLACGVAGLALAGAGSLGGRLGLLGPVVSYAGLVVALGATIVGTTLAALALLATRGGGVAHSAARSRTWVGAALNLGLLLALLVVFAHGVGRPLVVETGGDPAATAGRSDDAPREAGLLDAAALRELRAAHPDLLPVAIAEPADVAYARARRTARALGWEIVARDDAARRLDARAGGTGPDLEIRVHPAPDGSVVAIRPRGDADVEESLARIRAFSERLTRR